MRPGRGCVSRAGSRGHGCKSSLNLPQSLLMRPFLSFVRFNEGEMVALSLLLLCKLCLTLSFLELLLPSQLSGLDLLADLVGCLLAKRRKGG